MYRTCRLSQLQPLVRRHPQLTIVLPQTTGLVEILLHTVLVLAVTTNLIVQLLQLADGILLLWLLASYVVQVVFL